jgi:hypothetical protein
MHVIKTRKAFSLFNLITVYYLQQGYSNITLIFNGLNVSSFIVKQIHTLLRFCNKAKIESLKKLIGVRHQVQELFKLFLVVRLIELIIKRPFFG